MAAEEDLKILDAKVSQLKLAYEQYFLGNRPREPIQLRSEVQKLMVVYSNEPIQNTALRFKFRSTCSRFQAFKRQWDDVLRRIEQGTYQRHRFRADLHERERARCKERTAEGAVRSAEADGSDKASLFDAFVEARRSVGLDVSKLTPGKLEAVVEKQRASLRSRFGEDTEFRFRVVVEEGQVRLKASQVRASA